MCKGAPEFILWISPTLQSKTVPSKLPAVSSPWPWLASGPCSGIVWESFTCHLQLSKAFLQI